MRNAQESQIPNREGHGRGLRGMTGHGIPHSSNRFPDHIPRTNANSDPRVPQNEFIVYEVSKNLKRYKHDKKFNMFAIDSL